MEPEADSDPKCDYLLGRPRSGKLRSKVSPGKYLRDPHLQNNHSKRLEVWLKW
jgi:hypothetical protein